METSGSAEGTYLIQARGELGLGEGSGQRGAGAGVRAPLPRQHKREACGGGRARAALRGALSGAG